MEHKNQSRKLNRFTTLPFLLDMLTRRKLVLLDPSTWEDKNDYQIILEYKARKGVPKLFAVCFSSGDETVHDWKTYASGISGCCIEFNKKKLLESLAGSENIRSGDISYKKIKEVIDNTITVDQIPFTKRYPYRIEKEFRIIWEGQTNSDNIELNINLDCINRITINQNMPTKVYDTIVNLLREKFKDPQKIINKSTLFENADWIRVFKHS